MDDRRNEAQDNMHRKPERNDQNWRARGWKESYCRWYSRKDYHLDDVWRENYDDDDDEADNKDNLRSYSNQQCTVYNRNSYGSYSHSSPYQSYVWNYGPHQLRPEPYRNSSNRSRGHNTHRSHFWRYESTYSSSATQRQSSSNSNAPARDSCNNILDNNLLARLNTLHDTNDGHVATETDLPNLEEPMQNLLDVIDDDTDATAGAIDDTPVSTKRYNNMNLITINTNRSYLPDFHAGSSLRQDNANSKNSTLIGETERPSVTANDSTTIVESETVDQSPNNGSNHELQDYDLSFFNDSLTVETEVTIDVCGDVEDEIGQLELLTNSILPPVGNDSEKGSKSIDSTRELNDRQVAEAEESESLSQIINFINSTAGDCGQATYDPSSMENQTSAKMVDVSQGGELRPCVKGSDKQLDDVQKRPTKKLTDRPPSKVSHRRKTCTQEEATKVADSPVKRLKMSEEPRTSHNGHKPSKIHKRRKTIAAEWVISGSYQNTSELKEPSQKDSKKSSSEGRDQITIYDRKGEFAFVSSVAKYESLSSDPENGKVAPVKIVRRRNTVAVQDVEDAGHKHSAKTRTKESSRKHVQTRRKSIASSSEMHKEAHSKEITKAKDAGRRPSGGGGSSRSKHPPGKDRSGSIKKHEVLKELRVHLPKLPPKIDVMVPLKEYVPPSYAKPSKKSRNSKFIQLFGPDSDDETSSSRKSSRRATVDSVPWKLKRVDDYLLDASLKHGQDSTCDDVFETVVEFNVEGTIKVGKEVAKLVEIKQFENSAVTETTLTSYSESARQDCCDPEIESIKEINNLMQMHCPSNESDPELVVCVPDLPHEEDFQQPVDIVMAHSPEEPQPVIRGKRGRGRGRGNRKVTPMRSQPSFVIPPRVSPTRSSAQGAQAITHVEFCEALWTRIFCNVKNCEMLVRQKNNYHKIYAMKQQADLALKRHHQAREKDVEELAGLLVNFLRKRTITHFTYKEFLRSCYNYGGATGMRVTLPAMVKFLFSVVQKIKEIEPHLDGFLRRFCSDVGMEYENSVRWMNVRDDFVIPKFPPTPPPPSYSNANSEAEVTTAPVSVAVGTSSSAPSASSTTVIPTPSTTSVPSPPICPPPPPPPPYRTPDSQPTPCRAVRPPAKDRTRRLQDAVVPVRDFAPPPPPTPAPEQQQYGFTPLQRQLLNLQILQYSVLCKVQLRLLSERAQHQQWYQSESPQYYPPSNGFPRCPIEQTPELSTNPLDHNAQYYSSSANSNVSHANPLVNDNFRIRLPLSVPHNQEQITHVTPPSTPEILPTETPAPVVKRSASPIAPTVVPPSVGVVVNPIKEEATPTRPTVIKTNNSPPDPPSDSPDREEDVKPAVVPISVTFEDDEVIDVDLWFIEKMKQSDFIDLDDYDMPNSDPHEKDVKVENPAQDLGTDI